MIIPLLLGLAMVVAMPIASAATLKSLTNLTVTRLPQGGSSITGHVWDAASRRPLDKIRVELLDEVDSVISTARTDGSGRYIFNGLSNGTFQVRVLTHGTNYVGQSRRVQIISFGRPQESGPSRIGAGQVIQQDFMLRPGGNSASGPGSIFVQEVPAEARKIFDQALQDLDSKKNERGLEGLKKAIEIFPNYYYALERLGTEYVKLQYFEPARILLSKAVEVNPRAYSSLYALGIAQYNLKQNSAALESLRRAISLNPDSVDTRLWLGIALMRDSKMSEAETEFKDAIAKGGKHISEVYWRLAKVYETTKRLREAADAMETFLKLEPKHPQSEALKRLIERWREKAK